MVALVGDNGAGKSTLVKAIAGVHQPDGGQILLGGRRVHLSSPQDAADAGIATVYQDLALCNNLDILANLYLGREIRVPKARVIGRFLARGRMSVEGRKVFDQLAITLPPLTTPVGNLSGGQRQAVAVARAILWGSSAVLFDEPTAALGVQQQAMVHSLIRRLRERGLGVLLVSHNLADVFALADRIVVLRLGRTARTFDPKAPLLTKWLRRSPAQTRSSVDQRRRQGLQPGERHYFHPRRRSWVSGRAGAHPTQGGPPSSGRAAAEQRRTRCAACCRSPGRHRRVLPAGELELPLDQKPLLPDTAVRISFDVLLGRDARSADRRDRSLYRFGERLHGGNTCCLGNEPWVAGWLGNSRQPRCWRWHRRISGPVGGPGTGPLLHCHTDWATRMARYAVRPPWGPGAIAVNDTFISNISSSVMSPSVGVAAGAAVVLTFALYTLVMHVVNLGAATRP